MSIIFNNVQYLMFFKEPGRDFSFRWDESKTHITGIAMAFLLEIVGYNN